MKSILIVDDEFDISSTLELVLSGEGYEVRTAFHGREALETLREEPRPDLILCDVMMPVMNGYQFLNELLKNEEFKSVPVILMSAAQLESDKLPKAGRWPFVRKPFDLDVLLKTIQKTIDTAGEGGKSV